MNVIARRGILLSQRSTQMVVYVELSCQGARMCRDGTKDQKRRRNVILAI